MGGGELLVAADALGDGDAGAVHGVDGALELAADVELVQGTMAGAFNALDLLHERIDAVKPFQICNGVVVGEGVLVHGIAMTEPLLDAVSMWEAIVPAAAATHLCVIGREQLGVV